jgi:hypothetical protein
VNNSDSRKELVGEIYEIVVDVYDLVRSARFWSAVLGLKVANRRINNLILRDKSPIDDLSPECT